MTGQRCANQSKRRFSDIGRAIAVAMSFLATIRPVAAQSPPTHIRTRWAALVSPDHPLPEYPRPQMVRSTWTNLNGSWDYAITAKDAAQPVRWDGKILVPFPVQSQLSGVERAVNDSQRLWYHRTFTRPALPRGSRLLLHFGAVDWDATVYVNGVKLGEHRGGYDPFTFEITDALKGSGDQQLVVSVWDPTDKGPQPRGKQVLKPHSIWYSAVTGIWQTVWLEPVRVGFVTDVLATPDIDHNVVEFHVAADTRGMPTDVRPRIVVTSDGKTIGTLRRNLPVVDIPHPHLWSPSDPFLYQYRVVNGSDTVTGYFAMRKIAIAKDSAGINRLFLNNHPLFEYGTLDQGWWPDGLYTAPTDDALRFDIEQTKRLGFNMIRKHVKVEPDRWYYYADKIGMLVWQDMPSGDNDTPAGKQEFQSELRALVDALRNHPSIVMWVPFNEGWGQHDTERYVAWLKSYDPTRLVNNATGWTDKHVGDVVDVHAYPGPAMPSIEAKRAAVLGEFGGLGLPIAGHTWLDQNNWGYRTFTSPEALGVAYRDLLAQLRFLIADGLSAAVYTQTTDVEIEVNGLMTYDRVVVKLPADVIGAAAALWRALPKITVVLPTSQASGQSWRFTTQAPPPDWFAPAFNDATWQEGPGGFGTDSTPGGVVRTKWNTGDIWLRRSFALASTQLANPAWRIHHDEDAEVYLNGELVARLSGYTAGYVRVPLDTHARGLLRSGTNTLAVHVHQTTGGQYIDLGIDEIANP
jgi:hypothetical protein